MSKDKITELLLSRKATEATVAQFMALLANCEMARYSQHHTDASMEKDFSEAVQVISALDKQVKNK
jgi:aerotolerance-related protein batD